MLRTIICPKERRYLTPASLCISGLSDVSACGRSAHVAAANQRPLVADDVISASGGAVMTSIT